MSFTFNAARAGKLHLCGHRGHSMAAPENTIAAFKACHVAGGTSCEIDTVLTKDHEIIVLHDLFVDRTSNGSGAARDLTLAQISALDAGSWFDPQFAGEKIPALGEALEIARELDIGLEIEVKEKLAFDTYVKVLKGLVGEPDILERVMMISFDHVSLKAIKQKIPGIKTGGIVHERFGDPIAVARSADLDELCIDLAVFNLEDAARLQDEGIAIRCHAYKPERFANAMRAGLNWAPMLKTALDKNLIDTLSGDDVAWLGKFVRENTKANNL